MVVLFGKTCSGKDTILKYLVEHYGYKKMVTYTTRPMRKGEKNGVDYHFITQEEFMAKIAKGFFAEHRTYKTVEGEWYYGSAVSDMVEADDSTIVILNPDGVKYLKSRADIQPIYIYIAVSEQTLEERLMLRGDNPEEAARRLESDRADFVGAEQFADKAIVNENKMNIAAVARRVHEAIMMGVC